MARLVQTIYLLLIFFSSIKSTTSSSICLYGEYCGSSSTFPCIAGTKCTFTSAFSSQCTLDPSQDLKSGCTANYQPCSHTSTCCSGAFVCNGTSPAHRQCVPSTNCYNPRGYPSLSPSFKPSTGAPLKRPSVSPTLVPTSLPPTNSPTNTFTSSRSFLSIPGGDSDPVGRSTRLALRASFWQPRSYDTKDPYYDSFSFIPLLLPPGTYASPFYPIHGIPFSSVSGLLGSSFALQETVSITTRSVYSNLLFQQTVGAEILGAITSKGLTGLSSFPSIYSSLGPNQPAASR